MIKSRLFHKLRKSLAYRMAKDSWSKYAIETAFEGYKKYEVGLSGLGLTLRRGECECLLKGYKRAVNLKERLGAEFVLDDGQLFVRDRVPGRNGPAFGLQQLH